MDGKKFIKEEESEYKNIFHRFLKRDFSGNTGQAIKNSTYNFATTLTAKIGSILFTIIIARLLMPELFGLYSLTLATIVLFTGFSDLGLGTAMVRYVSKELGKKKGNPKGYFKFILKLRIFLASLLIVILGASAYYLANSFYQKPIFYALLAGMLYIFLSTITSSLTSLYYAHNNFKKDFFREAIFQISRLGIIPLVIIFTISYSTEIFLLYLFLGLCVSISLSLIALVINLPKLRGKTLSKKNKKQAILFTIPLTATIFSALFFGNIDTFMLGHYVSSEFIGYYSAAFALIGSATALITFAGAFLPVFSRLRGSKLLKALKKALLFTLPLSLLGILFTFILAKPIVVLVYGSAYLPAILIIKILSILFITSPLSGMFQGYFISQGKTKTLAIMIFSALILNIILNYLFITSLLPISEYAATLGAGIATGISRGVYLLSLYIITKHKSFK